jgi:IS5 family transposase
MSQRSFSDFEYARKRKADAPRTVPRQDGAGFSLGRLLGLIVPFYPKTGGGRTPFTAGNHTAHSSAEKLVLAERSGNG